MIKVILCEGKTDAILLSYYLEKVSQIVEILEENAEEFHY